MIRNINGDIDIDSLEIKDVIDINLLQKFQDNFAESMDIASITVDKNGKPVTSPSYYTSFCMNFVNNGTIGENRCAESHKKGGEVAARIGKPYIYTCHAGLIDFAAPILIKGKQIGTILGGQILTSKPKKSKFLRIAKELGVDEAEFVEALNKIKLISKKNVASAAEVLFIVANSLSQIGYEGLKLKKQSQNLEIEVENKNLLLRQSNRYNKLKTQLFSNISHELKTPINIICSSVQLLEKCNEDSSMSIDEVFSKYSGVMKQNCYRLIRMVNNIIDTNKVEVGFLNLNLKNKNIIDVIENSTLSIVEYAKLKDIDVIFDTEVEEKITAFDSEKIERIMLNILSNAIKFTEPKGNIYVTVYDKIDNILISIRDTGIGIPENMLNKIFNTFTQVDTSLSRNAEGSGIGLSLVKSLVEMHKGKITAKSKLGIGSEFIVELPINLVEDEVNKEEGSSIEKAKIEISDI